MKQRAITMIISLFPLFLCAQSVEPDTRIIHSKDANEKIVTRTKRVYKGIVQTWSDRATNAKVYQRFQVAKADAGSALTWFEACNWEGVEGTLPATPTGCAAYSEGDSDQGAWRVPTQKELALIWVLQGALKDDYAALGTSSIYCSATSALSSGDTSFYYLKSDGTIDTDQKSETTYTIRCIRDL